MSDWQDKSIEQYAVCLVDVLGIRGKFEKWNTCEVHSPVTQEPIRNTISPVIHFQNSFTDFFTKNQKRRDPAEVELHFSNSEAAESFLKATDYRLGKQQFSDTFVFYSPTYNADGTPTTVPCVVLLMACVLAMIDSLAEKHPVRGAVTVGLGVELEKDNLFGPVFAQAHFIESTLAGYPRVVISPEAIAFIEREAKVKRRDDAPCFMRNMACTCLRLLTRDSDGQFVVDYLGKAIRDRADAKERTALAEKIKAGYDFSLSEWHRFVDANDQKHALRYHLLLEYMESRLALWDINVSERQRVIDMSRMPPPHCT